MGELVCPPVLILIVTEGAAKTCFMVKLVSKRNTTSLALLLNIGNKLDLSKCDIYYCCSILI